VAREATKRQEESEQVAPKTKRLQAVAGFLSDPESGNADRLIRERIRLGIMSALSINRTLSFSELKDLLQTSDGNLSRHARKLEDAGYISCRKGFAQRVPRTSYSLTAKGRKMFERHLQHMEALIQATRGE
jgi:DNA-binding HxlR family transcriptional regulator